MQWRGLVRLYALREKRQKLDEIVTVSEWLRS